MKPTPAAPGTLSAVLKYLSDNSPRVLLQDAGPPGSTYTLDSVIGGMSAKPTPRQGEKAWFIEASTDGTEAIRRAEPNGESLPIYIIR